MKFPFNEPENVAVFTCCHIIEQDADICYVTHDEDDGAWQFLCGQDHCEADARVISLRSVFDKDPGIGDLYEMPLGCGATRTNKRAPWNGFRK
jgi:hypothetical protein